MTQWEDALAIVLKLPVQDQMRLVEYVISSVGHGLDSQAIHPSPEHWGRDLMDLVDTRDLSVWASAEPPEAWVRRNREEQAHRHQADWDTAE